MLRRKLTIKELKEMIQDEAKKLNETLFGYSPKDDEPYSEDDDDTSSFDEEPYLSVLDLAAKRKQTGGAGFLIPKDWANDIIDQYDLNMKQNPGDMWGEKSATFKYKGRILRLQQQFPGKYYIYRGAWERDPRWTGD